MRVLVACEFSGTVRDAFQARGHDAWSCDLRPTERPGNHIEGDALAAMREPWDLVIAHPPCTYLSYVGMRHWHAPGRAEAREDAMKFFLACFEANAPMICVENPLGYPSKVYRKPDQTIHPYYFGDPFQKRTCLWLKGLPLLEPTYRTRPDLFAPTMEKPEPLYILQGPKGRGKKIHWVEGISGLSTLERQKARAKTFPGIAAAMANQWGALLPKECAA